jgi:hypothetical protein
MGCGPSEEELQEQIARCDTLMMQRDSLRDRLSDEAALVDEVSSALAEVTMEEMTASTESPIAAKRDSILRKIEYLIADRDRVHGRLWRSGRTIERLETLSDSLTHALEEAVASYADLAVEEEAKRDALNDEIDDLRSQIVELQTEVARLEDEQHMVHYVIGTSDELLQRNIVEKVGGAHVLFFLWKSGETIVPARDLDESQFTSLDIRETSEIDLPPSREGYRIVSRQDLSALTSQPDQDGLFHDSIEIAHPQEFWDGNEFLIIVHQM